MARKKNHDITPPASSGRRETALWGLFALFVYASLLLPNVALCITEPLDIWGILANMLLPGGVYLWLMSLSRRIGRVTLWCFPLMFFAAFQLVLLYLYGRSVIASDMFLNLLTTNPEEAGEMLAGLMVIVIVVAVVYGGGLIGGIIAAVRHIHLPQAWISTSRRISYIAMLLGALSVGAACIFSPGYRISDDLYPVNVAYNIGHAARVASDLSNYSSTSEGYTFDARMSTNDTVPRLVILVIGETARAANWQLLGYDRPTNPSLSRRDGLVAYPYVMSQSNTTHKSVPMLLSAVDAASYSRLPQSKSIITAFKEAGYATAVITAQKPNHSYVEFFCAEADTTCYIADKVTGHPLTDIDLLPYVRDRIAQRADRQLIVVHAYGSHFDYRDRYPASMRRFTPDGPFEAKPIYRPLMINAYDNTILTEDYVLDSIAAMAEHEDIPAAMLYTSDHGEDLYDTKDERFMHASPIPTAMQVHVPMIVWLSPRYQSLHPEALGILASHRDSLVSSSSSYFHTALQLADITTPRIDTSLSLASPAYAPLRPMYVTDHNTAVPLKELLQRYHEPLPPGLQ